MLEVTGIQNKPLYIPVRNAQKIKNLLDILDSQEQKANKMQ